MPRRKLEVVVVGGGIGGLTAALSLKQAGHRVTVLERRPEVAEVNTGFLLWAFAIRRLGDLGLGSALEGIGAPLDRLLTLSWTGERLSELDLRTANARVGVPSYDVHRAGLQRALADALGTDDIELASACKRVFEENGRPAVEDEDGRRIEGDLVLGADGVRSTVRTLLFGRVPMRSEDVGVWRGVAKVGPELVPEGTHIRVMGPGGLFGAGRLSDRHVRWYAGAPLPPSLAERGQARRTEVLELFSGWAEPVLGVIGATEADAILFNDTPHADPFAPWSRGPIGLVGDAAHPSVPTLAYGGGMAIEDAAVLTQALASSSDPAEALTLFEGVRRKPTADIQRRSALFGWVVGWQHPLALQIREAAFSRPFNRLEKLAVSRLMRGGS